MPIRLLFAVALCSLLRAQEGGVPVIIDGHEVARVYSSVGSFTATQGANPRIHRCL